MATRKTPVKNTNVKSELPSAFSLFGPSWEKVQFNLEAFVKLGIIPLALSVILSIQRLSHHTDTLNYSTTSMSAGYSIITFLAAVVTLIVAPALLYTQLKSAQSVKVTAGEALHDSRRFFWRFYGLVILVGLIVLVGLILLIVPGIFMIKRYLLSPFFLVDKDLGVLDAMKQSAETSKQYSDAVWGLFGVEVLIAVVGAIPLVGWIANWIGVVTYYCAPALRYEQLKELGLAVDKK